MDVIFHALFGDEDENDGNVGVADAVDLRAFTDVTLPVMIVGMSYLFSASVAGKKRRLKSSLMTTSAGIKNKIITLANTMPVAKLTAMGTKNCA